MFTIVFIVMLVLLMVGVPVAFTLNVSGLGGLVSQLGEPGLRIVPKIMYDSMLSYLLTAVPLFIIMGKFLSAGGIGTKIYDFAHVWLRHLPGGVGIATIVSCAIMAAVVGSSSVIVAAIGMVALPELLRRGYPQMMATGAITAGGTLGILIPPSIPLLIYSAVTDESAGKLFAAGMAPGIVLALLMAGYISFASWRLGIPLLPKSKWAERIQVTRGSFWALSLPVIVLGSIYSGIATPTEAAALGALASGIIALFVYRTMRLRELPALLRSAASTSLMILFIVQGALIFGHFATITRVPHNLVAWTGTLNLTGLQFVLLANVLFLFMGCFLEVISIILITLPVMVLTLSHLDVDLVWFAIVMMVNMELALITPPVGINLYVMAGLLPQLGLPSSQMQIIKGILPYFVIMLLFLLALIAVPEFVTWIPNLLFK